VANFNANAFFTGPVSSRNAVSLLAINLLYQETGTTVLADGVVAAFSADFSPAVDEADAEKVINSAEAVSIIRGSSPLSLEARPLPQENDTIFLRMGEITKPAYQLQIFGHQMDPNGAQPYLQDRFLQTTRLLSLTDTNIIAFTTTADMPASFAGDRFRIVFGPSVVLPVDFTAVEAVRRNKDIDVSWTVATEKEVEKYEVQKSSDGLSFTKVGVVSAGGNSVSAHYSWLDQHAFEGYNYYRIRAIDISGTSLYSKIVLAQMDADHPAIEIYPNPVADQRLQVSINLAKEGAYTFLLLNAQGQPLMKKILEYNGGLLLQTLPIDKSVPAGIYYLHILSPMGNYVQAVTIL